MSYNYVLDKMVLTAEPFALCRLQGEGNLGLGQDKAATLHYILSGEGEARMGDGRRYPLRKGSLLLIPALSSHILKSYGSNKGEPFPACRPAEMDLIDLYQPDEADDIRTIGRGDCPNCDGQLVALCAHVNLGLEGVKGLIDLIRDPVLEKVREDSPLRSALEHLVGELASPGLGSKAMVRAYLMQAMLELLRSKMEEDDPSVRWMAALHDQSIWQALRMMLDAPGDPHSVESLADATGMSRSAFAQRFTDAYGRGPMELLRNLRMQQAARLLAETDLPVKRIAEIVGFRSRSAFTRMFEATLGCSPRSYRQTHKA